MTEPAFSDNFGGRATSRAVSLIVDVCPPSINAERNRHWARFHRAKRRWEDDLWALLLSEGAVRASHVHATASLRFPVRRRRDEGNFRWLLEKALGDALQKARWIADDTPEHFTVGALTFEDEKGPQRTTIVLEVRD